MTTTPIIRTPITYYGGKLAIIQHILPLIPEHDCYTETFFGGGTVFFAKDPVKNETINDRLDIVVNFYKVLKTKYSQLKKLIDQTLVSRTQHVQATMIIKKKVPADDVTLAWAFWMTTNFSFSCKIGGGIKFSNHQSITVPQNMRNKKERFTDELVNRLENTYIENNDALIILKSRNVENAFHYIDTPYPGSDQGHYKGYTETDFKNALLFLTDECKGKFLLSNYNSDLLDEFIKVHGWNKLEITHRLKAPRKNVHTKTEVLVWNYDIPKQQQSLFE